MNLAFFLMPVARVVTLKTTDTVADAVELLRTHRYTAVPLLDREGRYAGTLTADDLLMHLADGRPAGAVLNEVARRIENRPVGVDADIRGLLSVAADQNFVPVVDSRGVLMGIVTRKAILAWCERLMAANGLIPKIGEA